MLKLMTELMTISMIAAEFAVSRQRADVLSRRKDFPKPIGHLPSGRVWAEEAVLEWKAKNRPRVAEDDTSGE